MKLGKLAWVPPSQAPAHPSPPAPWWRAAAGGGKAQDVIERAALLARVAPDILGAEHAVGIEDAVLRVGIDEGGTGGEQRREIEAPPLRMQFGQHAMFVPALVCADARRAYTKERR